MAPRCIITHPCHSEYGQSLRYSENYFSDARKTKFKLFANIENFCFVTTGSQFLVSCNAGACLFMYILSLYDVRIVVYFFPNVFLWGVLFLSRTNDPVRTPIRNLSLIKYCMNIASSHTKWPPHPSTLRKIVKRGYGKHIWHASRYH